MLANQLNVLLAERQTSIKKVVEDTGISRSAISNISNNPTANIATDTIDKLCRYLDVTPSDFFVFSPIEFKFEIEPEWERGDNETIFVVATTYRQKTKQCWLGMYFNDNDSIREREAQLEMYDLYIELEEEMDKYTEDLIETYESLPVIFQHEVTLQAVSFIENFMRENADNIKVSSDLSGEYGSETFLEKFLENVSNKKETSIARISINLPWADISESLDIKKLKFV